MKKNVKWIILMAFLPLSMLAQHSIKGKITEKETGLSLTGAHIVLEGQYKAAYSHSDGSYVISNLKEGTYTLKVSYVGYETQNITVELPAVQEQNIELTPLQVWTEEVVVSATRASDKTATTYKELSKADIEKQNTGQDMPMLLNQTPSTVVNSDAGAGVGYTGIRIRGSDVTRINVTVNGIPVNDSESHGVFWVNMPDFASSVNSIQVQRGAGTSTNGAGAFGASINVQTQTLRTQAYAESFNSYGSFNTLKNNIMAGTGLINNKFTLDTRLSRISSDGFIDRASSDLKSYYVSGGYYGKKSVLKLNVFSGKEKTYQAWYGVPEAKMKGDNDALLTHYYSNLGFVYQTPDDSVNLFSANNRKYNYYTYPDQTDNYRQDHYQALYNTQITRNLNLNAALHFTHGQGYYEEYKRYQDMANYGMAPVAIGNDTVTTTDLIRRRWLNNDFYGTVFSFTYNPTSKLSVIAGGAANQYIGNHYGQIVWAQYASDSKINQRYYDNDAKKNDINVYVKAFYQANDKLNLFADLQYRTISYSFLGYDRNLNNVTQTAIMPFFNPKAGITYSINSNNQLYASYSVANREPTRDDFTQSTPDSRPKSENMQNIEAGYKKQTNKYSIAVNYYLMNYKNQLINTGEINDVGAYIRSNVAKSYRSGIELEGSVKVLKKLTWNANITYSQNKIKEYTDYTDDYDMGGQQQNVYKNTDIAFSPSVIAAGTWVYEPVKGLSINLISKYVGQQYLDNTMNIARSIDAFFVNDFRINYNIQPKFMNEIVFNATVYNLLDTKYAPNGYTYGYIYGGSRITENYYYPQAGRNYMLSVGMKF